MKQDLHPRFSEEESGRRPTIVATRAPQYRDDGDSSPSFDTNTNDFRVEPRKRKSTVRGSNVSLDDEIVDEEVPPV